MNYYIILTIIIYYLVNYKETLDYLYSFKYKTVDFRLITNKIYINGEVTTGNSKINIKYLNSLNKNKPIYIIINSNGGSFFGGYLFIQKIKSLQKQKIEINCIAIDASSIAFDIFQSCNKKYITNKTKMMQHDLIVKFNGTITEFEEMYDFLDIFKELNNYLVKTIMKRSNLTQSEYNKLIKNEWSINGHEEIMKYNLADEIINFYE